MDIVAIYIRMPEGLYRRLARIRDRKGLKNVQEIVKIACDEYAEEYEIKHRNTVLQGDENAD